MNKYLIFIIRAIFSAAFAVVICRIFRPDAHTHFVAGLACLLLGISYLLEYYRKIKQDSHKEIQN